MPVLQESWRVVEPERRPVDEAAEPTVSNFAVGSLAKQILQERPDFVVHAAFMNKKPDAWSDAAYLNALATMNAEVLAAAAEVNSAVLVVSSSAVYGSVGAQVITESCERRPVSLYGIAKSVQEMLAEYYAGSLSLKVSVVRLFNLIGPGQRRGMLIPDWVSQVAAMRHGSNRTLRIRNQRTSRDFVDVRDAARALALVLDDFVPGVTLNVASGESVSLREVIRALRRLSPVDFAVVETDSAMSAADAEMQRGSYRALSEGWGWKPEISWEKSLRDCWDEWNLVAGQC